MPSEPEQWAPVSGYFTSSWINALVHPLKTKSVDNSKHNAPRARGNGRLQLPPGNPASSVGRRLTTKVTAVTAQGWPRNTP